MAEENVEGAEQGQEQQNQGAEQQGQEQGAAAAEAVELVEAEFETAESKNGEEAAPPPVKKDYSRYKQIFEDDTLEDDEKILSKAAQVILENKQHRTLGDTTGKCFHVVGFFMS